MRTIAGLAAAALMMGGVATPTAGAAEPSMGPVLDLPLEGERTASSWRTRPGTDNMTHQYPPLAALLGIEGHVRVECQAEIDGRVDGCRILSETPSGLDFGAATQRVAAEYTRNPATFDGKPIRSSFTLRLDWRLPAATDRRTPADDLPLSATAPVPLGLARRIAMLDGTSGRIHAGWKPAVDQQVAVITAGEGTRSGRVALEALSQGLDDAAAAEVERHAHDLAARMNEGELRSTVAFLDSPGGRAWMAAEQDQAGLPEKARGFWTSLTRAARTRFCARADCGGPASSPMTGTAP